MTRPAILTGVALALLASGARPAPVRACTVSPAHVVVDDTPANGVVRMTLVCLAGPCFANAVPEVLPVVDVASGETVVGTVLAVERYGRFVTYVLWRPAAPLVPGRSYEVLWRAEPAEGEWLSLEDYVFEALPDVAFNVTAATFADTLTMVAHAPGAFDCLTRLGDMCGRMVAVIASEHRAEPTLIVDVDLDPASANVFELRAAFWSNAEQPPPLGAPIRPASQSAQRSFAEVADAYCYRVELRNPLDGSTAGHEACLPHGALGAIESVEVPDSQLLAAVQRCIAPPMGYEREWCAVAEDRCAEAAANRGNTAGCDTVQQTCAAITAQPEPGSEPTPSSDLPDASSEPQPAGDGGATGSDAAAAPGASDQLDRAGRSGGSSGCSAGGEPARAAWAALALACLGLAACARRRNVVAP